jgi:hypothetical protein
MVNVLDEQLIYAVMVVALVMLSAGNILGFGRAWIPAPELQRPR